MARNNDEVRKTNAKQYDMVSLITEECEEIKELLLNKNASYGNSAMEAINVFSHLDPEEGIRIRIDDKLKRLQLGTEYQGDNSIIDLIGYLHLLRISRKIKEMEE